MFFFGDGSCKFSHSTTKCEWTQNKNILTFIISDQAIYKENLNGEKWSGTAHNSKIDRSWKSFGEAVFVEDWIKISYVPKDEKPKNESEENSLISGTAFFIDNNGHMITNHHVIKDCKDKSQISYNNENIKKDLSPRAYINGRKNLINRCLNNIIDNALKYGNKVEIKLSKENSNLLITIDDDGSGIPKKEYENVFKPFYKIDKGRTESKSSVGLGLSIASDIVKSHGGNIVLNKSKMNGLSVKISLPV